MPCATFSCDRRGATVTRPWRTHHLQQALPSPSATSWRSGWPCWTGTRNARAAAPARPGRSVRRRRGYARLARRARPGGPGAMMGELGLGVPPATLARCPRRTGRGRELSRPSHRIASGRSPTTDPGWPPRKSPRFASRSSRAGRQQHHAAEAQSDLQRTDPRGVQGGAAACRPDARRDGPDPRAPTGPCTRSGSRFRELHSRGGCAAPGEIHAGRTGRDEGGCAGTSR